MKSFGCWPFLKRMVLWPNCWIVEKGVGSTGPLWNLPNTRYVCTVSINTFWSKVNFSTLQRAFVRKSKIQFYHTTYYMVVFIFIMRGQIVSEILFHNTVDNDIMRPLRKAPNEMIGKKLLISLISLETTQVGGTPNFWGKERKHLDKWDYQMYYMREEDSKKN